MIEEKEIEIVCANRIKYYSKLGYKCSKYNDVIKISPNDLPNNSFKIVKIKCDECGKVFNRKWINHLKSKEKWGKDICNSCAKSGNRNHEYGKDRKEILEYARSFNKHECGVQKRSKEQRMRMSESRVSGMLDGRIQVHSHNLGRKLLYYSKKTDKKVYADSALEALRMSQLDKDEEVLYWAKNHGIKIKYLGCDNTFHNYVPDFKIQYKNGKTVIEEVKGRITEDVEPKKKAALRFCEKHGYDYKILTQNEINKNGEYRRFLRKLNGGDTNATVYG